MSLEELVAENIRNKDTVEVSSRVCRRCCHQISESQLCAICHHPFKNEPHNEKMVTPQTVIPYQIDYETAKGIFKKWKRKKWLRPTSFKHPNFTPFNFEHLARYEAGSLMTFMCPTIFFSCDASIKYRGLRGKTVIRGGKDHTRWRFVSGHFQKELNTMVVCNDYINPFFCNAISCFKNQFIFRTNL